MAAEEILIETRKNKHQELNGGEYPLSTTQLVWSIKDVLSDIDFLKRGGGDYPLSIPTTLDLAEARGNGTRILHGRISAIRKSGALTFIKLSDATGSMQLVATKNNLPDYEKFRLVDLADIVEVAGEEVLTKTGEPSLLLSSWKVLTKTHRPPPEKFAGIADPELKARKRYLDLMSSEETRARFTMRTLIIRGIRAFMEGHNFLEVETSTLTSVASGANAKPFTTHHNALDIELSLRIAPELYLKRLLVGGFDKVYEIGRNYRNEGIDTRHNPEFTMMESYQAYGHFDELISSTKAMLDYVNQYVFNHIPSHMRDLITQWRREIPFSLYEFAEVTMADAVHNACSKAGITLEWNGYEFGIHDYKISIPGNERLSKIDVSGMQHFVDKAKSPGEEMAALFEYVAEPFLAEDYRTSDGRLSCPVFITQYPKAISPLARANDDNPNVVDRFELFVEGKELANAFQELNDPDEQALRFREQLESNDKDPMAFDADYVEALEHGMPPAIGFGMGIDRLVMFLTNSTSIKDVILFPTLRPVK